LEGKWLDRIVGLNDVKTEVVMMQTPDSQANLELVKFYRPSDEKGIQQSFANTLGIRHIAFAVEDIEAVVAKLKKKGRESLVRYNTMKKVISYATFVGQRELF
jgi:4-hydroxyphenylpyruvate dioxygenase-like putative hemolysin